MQILPENAGWRPSLLFVLLCGVALGIFALDLMVPHAYTLWILYVLPCVAAAWQGQRREVIAAAILATALIIAARVFDVHDEPLFPETLNRALVAMTLWLVIGLFDLRARGAKETRAAVDAALAVHDRLSSIILDTAEDAIVCVDETHRIRIFNHGAERQFGFAATEALGQDLSILLPPEVSSRHLAHMMGFARSPDSARRLGERGSVMARRKDGSLFPVEISISKLAMPEGMMFMAIVRDISERLRFDRLAQQREQRLRLALSVGRMRLFDFDEVTRTINHDRLGGDAAAEEPRGRALAYAQLFDIIHPLDRDRMREAIDRVRREGGEFDIEFRVGAGDDARWILARGVVELGPDGRPQNSAGVTYDITERRQAEALLADTNRALEKRVEERTTALREQIRQREEAQAALLRSQKLQAVGELAGGMAHDFNNLLTIILGYLELLGLQDLGEKAQALRQKAEDATHMGARLASRLLLVGRRQRLQPVSMDLNDLARGMVDVLRRTLGDQIEIENRFAADLWPVMADVSEVENAILNLAINARDAMPKGGRLVLSTENHTLVTHGESENGLKPGDYVVLAVSDNGTGIPPEHLARVFEPYFTTKEAGRGTGLGLSTIYGFAQQSGGNLSIQSEVGRGTTLHLWLPRALTRPVAPAERREGAVAPAAGETVLVVEDNDDLRSVTAKRLDMLGYRVLVAESGVAALAVLEADRAIDLVFSDVVMPNGVSGLDLVVWIRKHRPAVRVLLATGFMGDLERRVAGDDLGQVRILPKPYSLADLARAVREVLG